MVLNLSGPKMNGRFTSAVRQETNNATFGQRRRRRSTSVEVLDNRGKRLEIGRA